MKQIPFITINKDLECRSELTNEQTLMLKSFQIVLDGKEVLFVTEADSVRGYVDVFNTRLELVHRLFGEVKIYIE